MLLLPYENITYKTSLKADEVLGRLSAFEAANANSFSLGFGSDVLNTFTLHINGSKFRMNKWGRNNSFTPVILGVIEQDTQGSIIRVTMRPYYLAILFVAFFYYLLSSPVIDFFRTSWSVGRISTQTIAPLIAMVLIYFMVMLFFKIVSIPAIKQLQTIINAEIVK